MLVFDEPLQRAPQPRLGCARRGFLRRLRLDERPVQVAGKDRIAAVELRQQALHEARGRRSRRQPVVDPLAIPDPLNQSCFTEDAQMTADARLALTQRLREIGNAQIALVTQGEQPQPTRLSGCA